MKSQFLALGSIKVHLTQAINFLNSKDWSQVGLKVTIKEGSSEAIYAHQPARKTILFHIEPVSSDLTDKYEPCGLEIIQTMEECNTNFINFYCIHPDPIKKESLNFIRFDEYPEPGSLGEIFSNYLLQMIPEFLGFPPQIPTPV